MNELVQGWSWVAQKRSGDDNAIVSLIPTVKPPPRERLRKRKKTGH
jgi:hypothetical protein